MAGLSQGSEPAVAASPKPAVAGSPEDLASLRHGSGGRAWRHGSGGVMTDTHMTDSDEDGSAPGEDANATSVTGLSSYGRSSDTSRDPRPRGRYVAAGYATDVTLTADVMRGWVSGCTDAELVTLREVIAEEEERRQRAAATASANLVRLATAVRPCQEG